MKIGIVGSGDVGKSFARAFIALGHEIRIGSRNPAKLSEFGASAATFEDTARFGEIIVIATLGTATEDALRIAGPANFKGKIVIDATNPLEFAPGAPPRLAIGHSDSLGERVQRWLPDARVVKAFNTVGNTLFFKPQLPGGPPDMFLCGNDADAKKSVSQICKDFGWGVIDIGGIESARYLEPMCLTWVLHGILTGSWTHAFKMLHAADR
ncbi:MAG TPA: NAD(P)-binding domain-containing protein [Thermoanaerobaculia bacterium]|nr:NAD(P)-binding domain-containing protein [Thermoanaerobaculia bacterium]